MKRIAILIMVCVMALIFIPTSAYAADNPDLVTQNLDKAVQKVKNEYPTAELLEAHWLDPQESEPGLGNFEVVFKHGDNETIYIEGVKEESGDMKLREPELLPGLWEDEVINWEAEKDQFSFSDAKAKFEQYKEPCKDNLTERCSVLYKDVIAVSLENPDEEINHPYYIFHRPETVGEYILVDTKDGFVGTEEEAQDRESGMTANFVRLGTQCLSRVKPKFANGGRWVKQGAGSQGVDVICERQGVRKDRDISTVTCKSKTPSKAPDQKGYVNKYSLACNRDKSSET